MQEMNETRKIDPMKAVLKMRENRKDMIQNEVGYIILIIDHCVSNATVIPNRCLSYGRVNLMSCVNKLLFLTFTKSSRIQDKSLAMLFSFLFLVCVLLVVLVKTIFPLQEQYIFLHKALVESFAFPSTELTVKEFQEKMEDPKL